MNYISLIKLLYFKMICFVERYDMYMLISVYAYEFDICMHMRSSNFIKLMYVTLNWIMDK